MLLAVSVAKQLCRPSTMLGVRTSCSFPGRTVIVRNIYNRSHVSPASPKFGAMWTPVERSTSMWSIGSYHDHRANPVVSRPPRLIGSLSKMRFRLPMTSRNLALFRTIWVNTSWYATCQSFVSFPCIHGFSSGLLALFSHC